MHDRPEEDGHMSTPTLDQLLAAGQLVVEPKASLDLPSHQVLTVLRVEIAPHTVEPPHTHPGAEVLYGLAGHGQVELDNRERWPLAEGDAVVVERGRLKSLRNPGEQPITALAVLVLDADRPPILPAPEEGP
jgi:quercetin dioxygenase-like cupin family protein